MAKYERHDADIFICPSNPQKNFNNTSGVDIQVLTAAQVLPYSLITGEFPVIKPKRQDEEAHGVGGGRNPSAILEKQFEIGAGSIPNKTIFGLMIPKIGGDITPTHTAAEVWTIVAIAKADITTSTYIEFDVISAASVITKYYGWFDKNGDNVTDKPAAPTAYGASRTAVQFDISLDVTDQEVSDCITAAITALADVTAANGAGASTTVTVTNGSNGAVDDAHDVDSGLVIATTTNGRTKMEIVFHESTIEHQNFGFHVQRVLTGQDRIMDMFGITIATYEMSCEEGGVAEENIDFTVASFITASTADIPKMRGTDGVLWTKKNSPFPSAKKNYGWHSFNENFTFTMSGTLICTKRAFSVRIENELHHNYEGGGTFAAGVDFGLRHIEIGIEAKVEDKTIFELADQHVKDYAGDIALTIKAIRGTDTNDYIEWDFTKLRMLPIDEKVAAPAEWVEKYNLKMKLAPNCVAKCTIEGYTSFEYYIGKVWA